MKAWKVLAPFALATTAWTQVTVRVDLDHLGHQSGTGANLPLGATVSTDGRYVVFTSASSLVPGDSNFTWDVMVRDRLASTTELISVDSAGTPGNGPSGLYGAWITPDGRYVAFESPANDLVSSDTNAASDVFLRDRLNGTTELVSVATGGAQGDADSLYPSISADGRYVAFTSDADNLVSGDTNAALDVFVRDRLLGTTELVSVGMGGAIGNADSYVPRISADGRYVAFESIASNLVPGDTNANWDVFVWDRLSGAIECASISSAGAQGNSISWGASISSDGRFVGFTSGATNLVPGDTNGALDAFIRDRQMGTTERISVRMGGAQLPWGSAFGSLSADGHYATFASGFTILRDRWLGTTEIVCLTSTGGLPNGPCGVGSISPNGRCIAFGSSASNLVPGDTNANDDVFVRDRAATGFQSLCWPGSSGVAACPCANPPSGSGQGCDNSAATGGATLAASGIAYLSMDSLVFSTGGELPTAFSVVMQGTNVLPNGLIYGQGVRCVGGATKHLFTKTAVAGSVTVPDFGAGDPTVSARSASKGDVIQPGQSRYYLVYYRDLVVLGGCPASSTFNATQTGQVTWWP
jgi:Tol biopolymer transport system component